MLQASVTIPAVRLKGATQVAHALQPYVSIRQHASACLSIRQQEDTLDADAVQRRPADVLTLRTAGAVQQMQQMQPQQMQQMQQLRTADAVQQMQQLQQLQPHATADAERSGNGSKRNTAEAREQHASCNRCNSTQQQASTSEACTLRIGNVSRYSVYLLYWYKSTNTDSVFWEFREKDLREAISPHSIRMLTYADVC
jgi:hypothetical protein